LSEQRNFQLKFWGTRGSIACPGPDFVKYGGNTTCFEITCGKQRIIIDAGTGIRMLGRNIMVEEEGRLDCDLFFTHTHIDHIQGLPFFAPVYNPDNSVRLHAGHLSPPHNLRSILDNMLMKDPVFPVASSAIERACSFNDFTCGQSFDLGDGITIHTGKLNHPNNGCGYRVEFDSKSVTICTDTEHFEGKLDQNVVELARGTDLFVYDSTYTDEEYPRFKGWGHSTWQEAIRVGEHADAKKIIIFHHDPSHSDDQMDEIAEAAAKVHPNARPAIEGEVIDL